MDSQAIPDVRVVGMEKPLPIKDRIAKEIKDLEEVLKLRKEFLKIVDSLPFQEGDVAYHKKHGNVIITRVILGPKFASPYELSIKMPDVKSDYRAVYEVTGTSRQMVVPEDELMLPTEMSKKLYGR